MREGVFSRRPALQILSVASSVCLRRNETTPAGQKNKAFFIYFYSVKGKTSQYNCTLSECCVVSLCVVVFLAL